MAGRAEIIKAIVDAARRAGGREPIKGLPVEPQVVEGKLMVPGPYGRAHDVAERYMRGQPFEYVPPDRYHPLNREMAAKTADYYDKLPMYDPSSRAAYDAMIKETLDQYRAIKESGLRLTPTTAETYPYVGNPRAVMQDVADRNHMAFFKTESGFGTPTAGSGVAQSHPLLQQTGEYIAGQPMTANDLFRVVHDYFGHIKGGYGFRAGGEDNAFRAHAAMYSPEARPAMGAETRGQNSWVNFGPHGEFNRTASGADTIYSPQKVGVLPDWALKYAFPGAISSGAIGEVMRQDGEKDDDARRDR